MKQMICWVLITLMLGIQSSCAQKQQISDYNYQRACELHEQDGNPEEILPLLNKQLDQTPNHIESLLLRSLIYLCQGKVNLALTDTNLAIAYHNKKMTDKHIATLYMWRSDIYRRALQDLDKALTDCNTAFKLLKKRNKDLRMALLGSRAELYCLREEYTLATADFQQLLAMDETNLNAQRRLAFVYLEQGQYENALKLADKCTQYDTENADTYHLRMQIHDKMGNTDNAIDDALRYFEYDDEADISSCKPIFKKHLSYALAKVSKKINETNYSYRWLVLRTVIHELRGDYAQAIADYNRVEQEYGTKTVIYYYRALYYYELGNYDRAIDDITRFIELHDGKDYYAVVYRGDFYRLAGRYKEAIADFTRGIELNPTDVYAYYKRGWCYELSGDDGLAMVDYNAGIDIDNEYPYIFLMRGNLYLKRGDTDKAHADFEEIIRQDTVASDGSCRHYALHFLGRDEEAEVWMDQIIEQEPTDKGNYYDKACLLALMGRLDESLDVLRRAFELGYRSFVHIEHDDDMNPLRELPAFQRLIEEYRVKMPQIVTNATEKREATVSEVPMMKRYGNTYEVACVINNLPLQFILDTGASTVTISSIEASFMLKNNYLKASDIRGKEHFSTAIGEIHEGTTICLREIKIGDAILRNVDALVVHNQQTPLLLGQSILERFGTITIDNINSKLIIKQQ